MPKDGATNIDTGGTSAALAVAESGGATKAAFPQHVPSSDGDLRMIVQNEASDQKDGVQDRGSDGCQKSRTQAVGSIGDLTNGAQNEASITYQQNGETETNRIENDLSNMQNEKSTSDSKSQMQNEDMTHISQAEHISSLEPKFDQDTGTSEKVNIVLDTFEICEYMVGSIHTVGGGGVQM